MIGKHATTVTHDAKENVTRVTCYDTVVFTLDHENRTITLNSGGWINAGFYYCYLPKKRINQAFDEFFGAGNFKVYQEKGIWYVKTPLYVREFTDGMRIHLSKEMRENLI